MRGGIRGARSSSTARGGGGAAEAIGGGGGGGSELTIDGRGGTAKAWKSTMESARRVERLGAGLPGNVSLGGGERALAIVGT